MHSLFQALATTRTTYQLLTRATAFCYLLTRMFKIAKIRHGAAAEGSSEVEVRMHLSVTLASGDELLTIGGCSVFLETSGEASTGPFFSPAAARHSALKRCLMRAVAARRTSSCSVGRPLPCMPRKLSTNDEEGVGCCTASQFADETISPCIGRANSATCDGPSRRISTSIARQPNTLIAAFACAPTRTWPASDRARC